MHGLVSLRDPTPPASVTRDPNLKMARIPRLSTYPALDDVFGQSLTPVNTVYIINMTTPLVWCHNLEGGGGGPIRVERVRTGLRMRRGGRRRVARCGGRRRCATRGGQRPRGRIPLLSDRADQTGEPWAREPAGPHTSSIGNSRPQPQNGTIFQSTTAPGKGGYGPLENSS